MHLFQALEQFRETLRDVSPILWGYYNDLIKQGFNEEQAFQLTMEIQRSILGVSEGK